MGVVQFSGLGGDKKGEEISGQNQGHGYTEEHVKLIIGPFVSVYHMTLIGMGGKKVSGEHRDKHTLRSILIKKYQAAS